MSVETELKLSIKPADLQRLKRHPLLRSLSTGRAQVKKLYSIYYDTQDLALRQHACALRLRRVGKQWLQTLKGGGQVSAGLHQRNEYEMPVASQRLDFAALEAAGGKLPHGVQHHLQPVFVTAFTRTIRMLNFQGALIELCLDSGEVSAGKGIHPISELELELKSGSPQQLFQLALMLLDIVPLQVEHTSKAEYGYLLHAGEQPAPVKGRPPQLSRKQDGATAVNASIAAGLAHIQDNIPGTLAGQDEEYLHQVRIGLRRLRVALALARRLHIEDIELSGLYHQVSDLCVMLGQARDWDVFITHTLKKLTTADAAAVLQAAQHARRQQHELSVAQLASIDFQRLLLRFGAWLQGTSTATASPRVDALAHGMLAKRWRRLQTAGAALQDKDPSALHALRIACKKMRYSLEMFSSLLHDCDALLLALGKLQDVLGEMNDLSVALRLLEQLDNQVGHDTLARIRERIEHERTLYRKRLAKAWDRYAVQKKCW